MNRKTYKSFSTIDFRAQCLRVVDGDTFDLFVDLGFHQYAKTRFRLYGYNTPELNSSDPKEREKAQQAKELVKQFLDVREDPDFTSWPLRIKTYKEPGNFGRWLCEVYFWGPDKEQHLGEALESVGLALPYLKYRPR